MIIFAIIKTYLELCASTTTVPDHLRTSLCATDAGTITIRDENQNILILLFNFHKKWALT